MMVSSAVYLWCNMKMLLYLVYMLFDLEPHRCTTSMSAWLEGKEIYNIFIDLATQVM